MFCFFVLVQRGSYCFSRGRPLQYPIETYSTCGFLGGMGDEVWSPTYYTEGVAVQLLVKGAPYQYSYVKLY